MKILLAKPTLTPREYYGKSRGFALVENFVPSLGLGYLASMLCNEGFEVRIQDPVIPRSVDEIAAHVESWKPALLGLSVFTPHVRSLPRLFSALAAGTHKPVVVAGGSHVSALPEEFISHYPLVDMAVVGEGELTLREIALRLDGEQAIPKQIEGTVYRENGQVVCSNLRSAIEDLDDLPFPARDLMEPLNTHRPTPISMRYRPVAGVVTSRGCPHKCTFCDRSVFGRVYRGRSPENVCLELRDLIENYGAKEIRFYDDDIAVDRDRAIRLAKRMVEKNLKIPWTCMISARRADKELLKAFRDAGCWQILMGLESGAPEMLRQMRKPTTLEVTGRAVDIANSVGIRIRADFLFGTPGETKASMQRTVHFARSLAVDFAHFCKFMPYPGSEIHAQLVAKGYQFDYEENWSDSDHTETRYIPEGIDPDDYANLLDWAYRSFYMRPAYILRRFLRIRTPVEFWGHVKGFFAMIFLSRIS